MDYSLIKDLTSYIITIGILVLLWKFIIRIASSEVKVKVTDKNIILTTSKNSLTLTPCLHLTIEKNKKLVLSVGQEIYPEEQHIKVSLLNSQGETNSEEEYYQCLTAFFRYAFTVLINRKTFVLPKVSLAGAYKFKYESQPPDKNKIYKAIRNAGAIECKFSDQ